MQTMRLPIALFDSQLLRNRRNRAARLGLNEHQVFVQAVLRLEERLQEIRPQFRSILQLGARSPGFTRKLRKRWPKAFCIQAESAWECLIRSRTACNEVASLVAEEERLCFAPETFDCVVSLLTLHWVNDIPGLLAQIRRILRPDGLFLAVFLGGESLFELRASLMRAESEVSGKVSPRVSPFVDLQTATGLLQRAGFALPTGDVDKIRLAFPNAWELFHALRKAGASNAMLERHKGLTSPAVLNRAAEIYQDQFAAPTKGVRASFDLIFLTGWAPAATQPKAIPPGSARRRLADVLGVREQKAGEKAGEYTSPTQTLGKHVSIFV